jgi:hypothetical protein
MGMVLQRFFRMGKGTETPCEGRTGANERRKDSHLENQRESVWRKVGMVRALVSGVESLYAQTR